MKLSDILSILGFIIGAGGIVGAVGFPQLLDSMLGVFGVPPGWGVKIAIIVGGLAQLAAAIKRIIDNKTGAPATEIVAGATIVPAGTTVVHTDTPRVAQNVVTLQ